MADPWSACAASSTEGVWHGEINPQLCQQREKPQGPTQKRPQNKKCMHVHVQPSVQRNKYLKITSG